MTRAKGPPCVGCSKERPILFSAPMVRAILDGTKSQTRRIVKMTERAREELSSERAHVDWQGIGGNGREHWCRICNLTIEGLGVTGEVAT